jgi:hypothetical protein
LIILFSPEECNVSERTVNYYEHFTKFIFLVFEQDDIWYNQRQISIFIENFFKFFEETSAEIVIAALIYIERLLDAADNASSKTAKITETNAKGILHTAMTLASKF